MSGRFSLDNRFVRFLLVGISNAAVSFIVFRAVYDFLFIGNVLFAQPLSYGSGIVWSYFWNRKWTFRSSGQVHREFIWFVGVQLFLLLLSTWLVHLAVDIGGMNASIGWLLVMAFITVLNFLLTKMIVFK